MELMVISLLVGAATLAKERPVSNGFKWGNAVVSNVNVCEGGKDSFWLKKWLDTLGNSSRRATEGRRLFRVF